jgi:hypothetical protein
MTSFRQDLHISERGPRRMLRSIPIANCRRGRVINTVPRRRGADFLRSPLRAQACPACSETLVHDGWLPR